LDAYVLRDFAMNKKAAIMNLRGGYNVNNDEADYVETLG
jgi:hypothetical protein